LFQEKTIEALKLVNLAIKQTMKEKLDLDEEKKNFEEAEDYHKRQVDISQSLEEKMADLEKERVTLAYIMRVLQREIQPLQQLEDLLSFFQAMTNFFDKSLGPYLEIFVERANKVSTHLQRGITPSDICIELMYHPAKKAVKVKGGYF
jgi:hypothetical protein